MTDGPLHPALAAVVGAILPVLALILLHSLGAPWDPIIATIGVVMAGTGFTACWFARRPEAVRGASNGL
jgi:hypothetical protein